MSTNNIISPASNTARNEQDGGHGCYGGHACIGTCFCFRFQFRYRGIAQTGKSVQVEIVKGATNLKDKSYKPNPVKVKAGFTVTWKNVDSAARTVTSGKSTDKDAGKLFDSKILGPKKEFSFKFDKKGTFDYYCQLHPTMVGKVAVS